MSLALRRQRRRPIRPSGYVPPGFGTVHMSPTPSTATSVGRGMLPPTAPGAPAVTIARAADGTLIQSIHSVTGQAVWSLLDIEPQRRNIVGRDGRVLRMPDADGTPVGQVITGPSPLRQWADPQLASACVADARTRLNQAVAQQSSAIMFSAMQMIMAAYNAANVPFQIHPAARFLWEKYMSGPPASIASEFSSLYDFNLCTTAQNQLQERVFVGTRTDGIVPAGAHYVFDKCLPAGTAVAQTIYAQFDGLYWCAQGLPPGVPPMPGLLDIVWPSRDSDGIVSGSQVIQNFAVSHGDYVTQADPRLASMGGLYAFGSVVDSNCNPIDSVTHGWDAYGLDTSWVGSPPPLRFAGAPRDYVAWLDEWLSILESLSVGQLILDSRAGAMYFNANIIHNSGDSLARAIASMTTAEQLSFSQNAQAAQDLALVRASAPVVGALVGTIATVGATTAAAAGALSAGIGAVVVGSITAITLIAAALWPPDLSQLRLDQFLRPRPFLDRSWLAGSPSSATDAPSVLVIDAPDGFVRDPRAVAGGSPVGSAPASAPMSKGTEIAIAGGVVVGAAVLAQLAGIIDLSKIGRR